MPPSSPKRRRRMFALPRFVAEICNSISEFNVARNDVDRRRIELVAFFQHADNRVEPGVVAGFRELLDSARESPLISISH